MVSKSLSFRLILWGVVALLVSGLSGCGSTREIPHSQPPPEAPPKHEQAPAQPRPAPSDVIDPDSIPETPREMRAVWVASVANIDWPSAPGLPVAQQKAELRAIMDRAKLLHFNAIILQVRPAADALYDSPYEPWSEFLTGQQGKAPEPYYDPLKFAVEEAHRRGLALHAWFNPFRAYHFAGKSDFALSHVKNEHPDWVKKYGRYYWLDPGNPDARQYSRNVILDVARRYDIDGVHLDDYFYPYAEVNTDGSDIPFPDSHTYEVYQDKNGKIDRRDWRRQNIDQFIQKLDEELHKVKPDLRFGISPFGIWRPGHPAQIKGFDAFDRIYADARKWLREGWVDYLSPQLYWPVDDEGQSFPVLLNWWAQQNIHRRHLWPGLYTSRVANEWDSGEIIRQIELTREQTGASGNVHFSMRTLMNNENNIDGKLLTGPYAKPALIPATYWLPGQSPEQPHASLQKIGNRIVISLDPEKDKPTRLWVLKVRYGNRWTIDIVPGWKQSKSLPAQNQNGAFKGAAVSLVDNLNNESVPQLLLPIMENVEK